MNVSEGVWMMKRDISLKKWLIRYWLGISAILVVVYFIAQSYTLMLLTNRAEESIQKSISIASNGIEDSLEIVDSFIFEALYSSTTQSTSQLYNALENETEPVALAEVRSTVVSSLRSIVTWSDMIDFIMLYTDRSDESAWIETGTVDSYLSRREVKEYLLDKIKNDEVKQLERYMICNGKQDNYMVRLIKIKGSYLVVGVSQREILSSLQKSSYNLDSISFAADQTGSVIYATEKIASNVQKDNEGKYVKIDKAKYLQTGCVSEKTGYYFGVLTSRTSIVADIWIFRIVFFVLFLVLSIVVPISFYIIYRYVEKPIEKLSETMNQISEGELDITVEDRTQISELSQFVSTFNYMIERIKKLKIEKYEGKLEAQKATLQYLQLQIKPHFYANVLNIIYSLAEQKDYETIQKISKAIVSYSRYMFQNASELVELKHEIEHVHYYMEIQEIRYMMQIVCDIDVPKEVENALIPPFVIQSFVENSVKYAFSTKKNCKIYIQVKKNGEKLYIYIRDNGEGYGKEILDFDWEHKNEEGHVGLINVYKRLKFIYGDKAWLQLKNDHGAVSQIMIPYIAVDNMESEDDF